MLLCFSSVFSVVKLHSYLHTPLQFQRLFPLQPLQRHHTDDAADTREPNAAPSGTSRAFRVASESLQRHAPALPPDTDAGNMQIVQYRRQAYAIGYNRRYDTR